MKSGLSFKMVLLWFGGVLGIYLAVFYGIEHWRNRGGPWEVHFVSDAEGRPAIVVNQPWLRVQDVKIVFAGETAGRSNVGETVRFNHPRLPVPFGRTKYEDLTQLPGVVTFEFFGHEIELLPRTLVVNRREVPWKSGNSLELSPADKVPLPEPKPKRKGG
jgi:hypothetical protein